MKLYHITNKPAAENIIKGGFLPSKNGEWGPGVYLTDNPELVPRSEWKWQGGLVNVVVEISSRFLQVNENAPNQVLHILRLLNGDEKGNQLYEKLHDKLWEGARPNWGFLQSLIKEKGYEGIHEGKSQSTHNNYLVFDPQTVRPISITDRKELTKTAKYLNSSSAICLKCGESLYPVGPEISSIHHFPLGMKYSCSCGQAKVWTNSVRNPKSLFKFLSGEEEYYMEGFCNDQRCTVCGSHLIPLKNGVQVPGRKQWYDLYACSKNNSHTQIAMDGFAEWKEGNEAPLIELWKQYKSSLTKIAWVHKNCKFAMYEDEEILPWGWTFEFTCVEARGEQLAIIDKMDENEDIEVPPEIRRKLERFVGAVPDDFGLSFKQCTYKGKKYIAAYFSAIHNVFSVC